jgi:hypothetical protein
MRRWLRVILLGLMMAPGLSWAVPVAGTACSGFGSFVTTVSFACTASGSDRFVTINVHWYADPAETITSVTYAGSSTGITLIDSQAVTGATEVISAYRLIAPPTGSQTVAVNFSGLAKVAIGVIPYTGVNQVTPLGTAAKAGGSAATATVTVTSATGELVQDIVGVDQDDTLTVDGSQTQHVLTGASSNDTGVSTEAGAAPVVVSWTTGTGTSNWGIIGFSIKPVAAAPSGRRSGTRWF